MEKIKCNKCFIEYDFSNSNFNFRNRNKNILERICKNCRKEYRLLNKEKIRQKSLDYYAKNKDRARLYNQKYRIENFEKIKQRKKEYREKNRDKINLDLKRRNKENKEKYSIAKKLYVKTEKGKLVRQVSAQKYHSKRKNSYCDLTNEQWGICLQYFDFKDAYTRQEMNIISQDHIIPQSKGGKYTASNIIPCDKTTNSSKCNKDMELWYRKQDYFSEEQLNKIKYWINNCEEIILKKLRKENKKLLNK